MEMQSWRTWAHCAELRVETLTTLEPRLLGGNIEIDWDGRRNCPPTVETAGESDTSPRVSRPCGEDVARFSMLSKCRLQSRIGDRWQCAKPMLPERLK
jgi:hypothetical protein